MGTAVSKPINLSSIISDCSWCRDQLTKQLYSQLDEDIITKLSPIIEAKFGQSFYRLISAQIKHELSGDYRMIRKYSNLYKITWIF